MRREARLAFNELLKLGAPVYDRIEHGAQFILGAELRTGDDHYFADYYQYEVKERYHPDDADKAPRDRRILNISGVRQDVIEILDKHGLYFEWINAGMGGVYYKR